jgi:D-amino-acid dehydrogenase
VATDAGLLTADRIVLALGSGSPLLLLQPLGIRIPVYPAKGCSITVPTTSPTPPVRPRARSWTRRTRWR